MNESVPDVLFLKWSAVVTDEPVLEDGVQGFDPEEVPWVIANYVCAVCHGPLSHYQVPGQPLEIVMCAEHGNVEKVGRVMNSTVSIELENGYRLYHEVIRNLPDLWGSLLDDGFEYDQAVKIRKAYVCNMCGGPLFMTLMNGTDNVNLACPRHGNINECGYVKKGTYRHAS
jgi:hypothetical protein